MLELTQSALKDPFHPTQLGHLQESLSILQLFAGVLEGRTGSSSCGLESSSTSTSPISSPRHNSDCDSAGSPLSLQNDVQPSGPTSMRQQLQPLIDTVSDLPEEWSSVEGVTESSEKHSGASIFRKSGNSKRNVHRRCAECGRSNTTQWRKGPFGLVYVCPRLVFGDCN